MKREWFRAIPLLVALGVVAVLLLPSGCTMDPDLAKAESRYKNTDGVDKTKKNETSTHTEKKSENREYELTITPKFMDGFEMPEYPDKRPTILTAKPGLPSQQTTAPIQSSINPVKSDVSANMNEIPQPFIIWVDDDRLEFPFYPGHEIHYRSGRQQGEETSHSSSFALSEEYVHKAVQAVPLAFWIGAGFFFLLGILIAVFAKGYRLLSIPVCLFTVGATVAVVLAYKESELLAWALVIGVGALGIVGMVILYFVLKSKNFYQQGFHQTVSGVNEFVRKNDASTGTGLLKTLKENQDNHIQDYIQDYNK